MAAIGNPVSVVDQTTFNPASFYANPNAETKVTSIANRNLDQLISEASWKRGISIVKAIGFSIAFVAFTAMAVASALLLIPGITAPAALFLAIGCGAVALICLGLTISAIVDAVKAKNELKILKSQPKITPQPFLI